MEIFFLQYFSCLINRENKFHFSTYIFEIVLPEGNPDFDSNMMSKNASIIAFILTAICFFDSNSTETGWDGQNELQFQYKGEYAEL